MYRSSFRISKLLLHTSPQTLHLYLSAIKNTCVHKYNSKVNLLHLELLTEHCVRFLLPLPATWPLKKELDVKISYICIQVTCLFPFIKLRKLSQLTSYPTKRIKITFISYNLI
jgi:hypothetical protein